MKTVLTIINLIVFQIGWFASILGAARGFFWLGPLVIGLGFAFHLLLNKNRVRECALAAFITVIGFITDTLLTAFGVYAPLAHLYDPPFSPPWLIFMWLNFATLFNVSIKWLRHRYFLSAVLGGLGGALAYYCGSQLGALEYFEPVHANLLFTGFVWAVLTPFFFFLANKLDDRDDR